MSTVHKLIVTGIKSSFAAGLMLMLGLTMATPLRAQTETTLDNDVLAEIRDPANKKTKPAAPQIPEGAKIALAFNISNPGSLIGSGLFKTADQFRIEIDLADPNDANVYQRLTATDLTASNRAAVVYVTAEQLESFLHYALSLSPDPALRGLPRTAPVDHDAPIEITVRLTPVQMDSKWEEISMPAGYYEKEDRRGMYRDVAIRVPEKSVVLGSFTVTLNQAETAKTETILVNNENPTEAWSKPAIEQEITATIASATDDRQGEITFVNYGWTDGLKIVEAVTHLFAANEIVRTDWPASRVTVLTGTPRDEAAEPRFALAVGLNDKGNLEEDGVILDGDLFKLSVILSDPTDPTIAVGATLDKSFHIGSFTQVVYLTPALLEDFLTKLRSEKEELANVSVNVPVMRALPIDVAVQLMPYFIASEYVALPGPHMEHEAQGYYRKIQTLVPEKAVTFHFETTLNAADHPVSKPVFVKDANPLQCIGATSGSSSKPCGLKSALSERQGTVQVSNYGWILGGLKTNPENPQRFSEKLSTTLRSAAENRKLKK